MIFLFENTGKVVTEYGVGREIRQGLEETFQLIQMYRKTSKISKRNQGSRKKTKRLCHHRSHRDNKKINMKKAIFKWPLAQVR